MFIYFLSNYLQPHRLLFLCVRSGAWTGGEGIWVELSGKMHVLARLLAHLRQKTDDRIVLVSNYTQVVLDKESSYSKKFSSIKYEM